MPHSTTSSLPRRLAVALALLVGAAGGLAWASDTPAPHAAEPSGRKAQPAAVASPASAATRDPLETLRQRLTAKIAGSQPPDPANPAVISVVSRPRPPETQRVGAEAPPARRKAAGLPTGAPEGEHAVHWAYDGRGQPEAWGSLKPEFAKCSSGTRQSPIDIRDGIRVDLEAIQFEYKPSPFRVIDNGHTVQVNVGPGNWIDVAGRRFELLQFHFHRPSEERINGKQFDMVAHLVHKDLGGRLAVVAVLLERGSAHAVVQNVWNNLPLEKNEEVAARGVMNMAELLPVERSYFTYMGSLTTPPCSEGVLWMVLKNPVSISDHQIEIFAHLYPMNARPLQAAAGRLIKQSN